MFIKHIITLLFFLIFLTECTIDSINKLEGNDISLLIDSIKNQDLNQIESVLKEKPELCNYQEPKFGVTPLLFAIKNKKYSSAKLLLKNHVNPNLSSFDGETPLTCILHNELDSISRAFFKFLVKSGGNINQKEICTDNSKGNFETTPLILASGEGEIDLVKFLISQGADINLGTYNNTYFPVSEALLFSQVEIVEVLCENPNFEIPKTAYERVDIYGKVIKVNFISALQQMEAKNDPSKLKIKSRLIEKFKK